MRCTFDNFIAQLKCSECGAVSPGDEKTLMQTHMRAEPKMEFLGVGSQLKIDRMTINECGYLTVRQPGLGESIHILQTWSCPNCKRWPQWAEIVITDDVIESISSTPLNKETLARSHYIDDEAKDVAAALVGRDYGDLLREDVVSILKQALI
jgi:hypothetical protein